MKLRQVLMIAVLLLGWVNSSNAKGYKPAKVYMFGFAASFNDSTVYMTNIQKVDAYLANHCSESNNGADMSSPHD